MTFRLFILAAALFAVSIALPEAAAAQQFAFEFKNPAFGGSYLNYSWMLQSAEAQKDYTEQRADPFNRDPLADFQNSLQRQILNQLSRELIYDRFRDIDLTKEGRFELGDYTVDIVPGLEGITITIFDVLNGGETTVSIPNF